MTEEKRNNIQQLFQEYDIESSEEIQNVLKDLLSGTIKEMMGAKMDDRKHSLLSAYNHLGYGKSERIDHTEQTDYHNGTKRKQVNTSYGAMTIDVPENGNSTFETQVVKRVERYF